MANLETAAADTEATVAAEGVLPTGRTSDTLDHMGVTGNAQLVCGFVSGAIMHIGMATYRLIEVTPAAGSMILEHRENGNTYRVSVVQLAGSEFGGRS